MSKRYPDLLVADMLDCIEAIETFMTEQSLERLLASRLHKDAIIRNLEVLGEAANRLPQAIQLMGPNIPWPQIISLRNRLIHEYHGVNWDILIANITRDLPTLKQQLIALQKIAPKEINIEKDNDED